MVRRPPFANPVSPRGKGRRRGGCRGRTTLRRGERQHGKPPRRSGRTRMTIPTDLRLSEEMSAGPALLPIDVFGGEPIDHVLDHMSFLHYRLADVRLSPHVTPEKPHLRR